MKKNFVRIVAAALVALLALTLIPLGAFAATVDVYDEFYDKTEPTAKDFGNNAPGVDYFFNETITKSSVTIKTSDYDKHVVFGDELPIKNIENACFISTRYFAGSAVSGTLAVICPQTVDYQRLFLAMEYFSQLLTQSITGTERK